MRASVKLYESGYLSMPILDYDALCAFVAEVVVHYQKIAPTVTTYADWLYVALEEERAKVTLLELLWVMRLREDGIWLDANSAANLIFKLLDRLGRDTSGQLGF